MILSHNMAIPQSTLLLFTFQRLHTSIRHNLNNIVFMPKPLSKCNKVLQKTQTSKQNNATKSKTQSPCLHGAWGYVTYKVFREEKIKKKYKIKKSFGFSGTRNYETSEPYPNRNPKNLSVRVPEPKILNISVRIPNISGRFAVIWFGFLVTDSFEHPYTA